MNREEFIVEWSTLPATAEIFLKQGFAIKAIPCGYKGSKCDLIFWRDNNCTTERKIDELEIENAKLKDTVRRLSERLKNSEEERKC